MKKMKKAETIAAALLALTLLASPAAAKKKRPIYPIDEVRTVAGERQIVVVSPLVRYEALPGADQTPNDSAQDVSLWLRGLSADALSGRGFDRVGETADDPAARELQAIADQYVRNRRGPDATVERVQRVAAGDDRAAVLVQYLEVQLASKGYWNTNTGGLGVGMSNSDLHGVLLDAGTGEVLWRGELYYRDVPDVDDPKWQSAVTDMYATLMQGREER